MKSSDGLEIDKVLTPDQVDEFHCRGVLVIRNFLSIDELAVARKGFHQYLRGRGIDPDDLENTAPKLAELSSTGGSGGVIDAFYQDWKLSLNENPKAVAIMSELWEATFAKCEKPYDHPFGKFDSKKSLMYIDRVCFRVPDSISQKHCSDVNKKRCLQRSLTPHIDCCPHRMFQDIGEFKYSKWRPIQAFIALTDTTTKNMGGFEACPGLHLDFESWTKKRISNPIKQKKNIVIQKSRLKNKAFMEKCSILAEKGELSTDIIEPIAGDRNESDGSDKGRSDDGHNIPVGTEPPCVGQFTPIRMIEDADIISRFEHVPCRAGDMVFWDYRIPHSNSYQNSSEQTREAVYIGLLPYVHLNKEYIKEQLVRYRAGVVPMDQWHSHNEPQLCDYSFSDVGRKMVGMDSWET